MLCPRCGAELFPGMTSCPECGSSAYGNAYKTASITISGREARQGVFKSLNMPQLTSPLRFRVKPGTKNGAQIVVNNAVFTNPDGGTMLIPVRVTVHVRRSAAALALPLLILLLCASFGWGGWRIVTALMESGAPQTQLQVNPPSQPVWTPATEPLQQATQPPALPQPTQPATTEPVSTEPVQTQPPATQPQADSPIPHYELRPLLHQLDEDLLTNLEAIYQAAMDFEPWVEFPCQMTAQELNYLTALMHTEFPELMQLDNTVSTTYNYDQATGYVTRYELPFVLSREEYERRYQACEAVIEQLLQETQGMSVWEKEAYVFEYITGNCTYDKHIPESNTPYGTLVTGRAKCDGISLAMKWIMEEMGIPCLCITGDPTVTEEGHAWNMILLDGAYYNVDVTMDVRKDGDECPTLYCALNVTNEMVLQTYILTPVFTELLTIPQVDTMERSYHVQHGSYVTSGSDWGARIKEAFLTAAQTGEGQYLQFESRADYEACMAGMNDRINEAVQEKELYGCSWSTWYSEDFLVLNLVVTT